jgi:tRNA A-37 threonylcarbamoyl transferase component Bud32
MMTFLRANRWRDARVVAWTATKLVTLILALAIAFRRPYDPLARVGSLFLASLAASFVQMPPGMAAIWRGLPATLGAALWIPAATVILPSPLLLTFFAIFPRRLFRSRWVWIGVWTPALLVAAVLLPLMYRIVYRPDQTVEPYPPLMAYSPAYLLAGLIVMAVNYRRLYDVNERRRVRVLMAGTFLGGVGLLHYVISFWLVASTDTPISLPVLSALSMVLTLAIPLSFTYAILRHRLFDFRIIVRRGLQYALARRLLLSVIPLLVGVLVLDLLIHGEQPLLAILGERGWIYGVLIAMCLVAYQRRQVWLQWLDRKFFRERYDAQQLLHEVVREIRHAGSLGRVATRVVACLESALHPEFVALLLRQSTEETFTTLACSPAGQKVAPLSQETKLVGLLRLLGKPLEVSFSESGWLAQQLPAQEIHILKESRIGLLAPVGAAPGRQEALLVLGVKRSEEPYMAEDQDLVMTIASSLALLLEKTPPEISASEELDETCAGFTECPQCGAFYDEDASLCGKDRSVLEPGHLPRSLVGRYRLERRLGSGAMGTVFEAVDTSLDRRVAVKVIREKLLMMLGHAEAAERFRMEARATAAFSHPNVVTVHDFGLHSETHAFFVMERLEGTTLLEELRRNERLPPRRVLSIVRGVCSALEAAHQQNLVHRDLKPANIFLTLKGGVETPIVLDFGVAKFLSSPAAPSLETRADVVLGTPRYMAPERLRGGPPEVGWDLWAMAVVTYEMLTGAYPFVMDTTEEWQSALMAGRFAPIEGHLPDAPPEWRDFFARAFALRKDNRPSSAKTFLSELQRGRHFVIEN